MFILIIVDITTKYGIMEGYTDNIAGYTEYYDLVI